MLDSSWKVLNTMSGTWLAIVPAAVVNNIITFVSGDNCRIKFFKIFHL